MSRKQRTTRLRVAAAYDALRGRPPKPDYGLLIVLPLIASAGGALIGIGVDQAVTRMTNGRNLVMRPTSTPGPVPVRN